MMAFARDFKPDVFILGGDQLNCGPVSHWNRGKPGRIENFRLKDELELLNKHIMEPVEKIAKEKIWLDGNHEVWITDLIEEFPSLAGMIEPSAWLPMNRWKSFSQGEIYKLGKLNFIHGDTIGSAKNRAQRLLQMYRRNIRCGHFHTYEAATDVTPYDSKDFHTGVVVPAMAACNAGYMKNRVSNHHQGFLYGWVDKDGSFSDHVMTIINGKFIYNGKVYDGRSSGQIRKKS